MSEEGGQETARGGSLRAAPKWIVIWVPFAIALISFVLSIYTFVVTSRPATVEIILPQQIRVAQGDNFGYAYLYFQPTLVSTGRSQQVEVVSDLTLEFAPADGGEASGEFLWRENGRIVYDPTNRQTTYEYIGDASPLLLSRETAQSPLGTFYGPPGWYFTPGEWSGVLSAEFASGRSPVQRAFRFTLGDEDAATLAEGGGHVYVTLDLSPQ